MRRRHWGLVASLILCVVLPTVISAFYMIAVARDQYASTTAFTIRQEETGSASELVGGLSQLVGGGTAGNPDLLFEYIQSQVIVERIDAAIGLGGHYSQNWPADPVFSIWPDATIEDLLWFWKRIIQITFDKSSGLLMVEVRASDPETARTIARLIVRESEEMINLLNENARRDSMTNAETDLTEALERLRRAREATAEFRATTQILDPVADIQGRMGVVNNLQQQLAQALVDHDLLLTTADANDPRVRQAMRRIEAIRSRIAQERLTLAASGEGANDPDYPRLLAQFESLNVDREFAEQTYRAALTAFDSARSNAQRQQIYLATYIQPTLAQSAQYPQRLLIVALTLLFSLMVWAIGALVYYSLRDRG